MKNLTKDVQECVRTVAYLMWEAAGRQHNMALQYWLNAEREIFALLQATTDVMMPAQTQRQKAALEPAQPASVIELNAPQGTALPGKKAGTQAGGKKLALCESCQPFKTITKARLEAAAEAPAGEPATQSAGGLARTAT